MGIRDFCEDRGMHEPLYRQSTPAPWLVRLLGLLWLGLGVYFLTTLGSADRFTSTLDEGFHIAILALYMFIGARFLFGRTRITVTQDAVVLSRFLDVRKTVSLDDIDDYGIDSVSGQSMAGYRARGGLHRFGFSNGEALVIRTKHSKVYLFRSDDAASISEAIGRALQQRTSLVK
jgi:hypothetical protein